MKTPLKTMNSTKLDGEDYSSTVETQAGLGATLLNREPRSRHKSKIVFDVIKSDGAISNVASCGDGRQITLDYETEFDLNPKYSGFRAYTFLVLHCISGFYFGYSMTCLNNLGKPILRDMGISDEADISSGLGKLNLAFGLTKVVASILGGSYQKSVGKLNLLLITEPLGILSTVLCCMDNIWIFSVGRVFNAFYLGFQSTCTPRLIMECFPTARRGSCTAMYGFFVCLGTASSFSLGQFGDNNLEDYWRYMLIFPAVLSVIRIAALLIFFPHDSPIHYT
jgi:sugar phosphate permease